MLNKKEFAKSIAAKIKERNIDSNPDLELIDDLIDRMIDHCKNMGFEDEFGDDEKDDECVIELYQDELEYNELEQQD